MKYLKKFESEINIGTWQHFNGIQPVNQIVLEPKPLFSFLCNECGFEFATEEKDQDYCSVCLSKDIEISK
jgi:hypothetical protein